MKPIINVLRGADPELFLRDVQGNPVTSIGLIGHGKENPKSIGNGFALQEDNVALEFNIPPAANKESFVASLNFAIGYIEQEIKSKGLLIDISPTMNFSVQQLDHPQAQQLGCEPDYNAWTQKPNPRPVAPASLRSAGGHLHLGWDVEEPVHRTRMIKAHDLFCGVWSLLHDKNQERRSIYGKAGACRMKDYGVEYRTLSNFWLKSDELMQQLFDQSEKAINFLNNGGVLTLEDGEIIQQCINNSDMNLFHKLNEQYSII